MNDNRWHRLKAFLIELSIYAVLVVGYVYFALMFLVDWLEDLYDRSKRAYAIVALLLIIGQGVALEALTTALLRLINSREE